MSSDKEEPLKRAGKRNPEFEARILRDMFAWMSDPNQRMKVIDTYKNNPIHNAKLYDFLEDLSKVVYGDEIVTKQIKESETQAEAKIEEIKEATEQKEKEEKKRASYIT